MSDSHLLDANLERPEFNLTEEALQELFTPYIEKYSAEARINPDAKVDELAKFQENISELLRLIQEIYQDFYGTDDSGYSDESPRKNMEKFKEKYMNASGNRDQLEQEELIRELALFVERGIFAGDQSKYEWGYTVGQNLGAKWSRSMYF